MNFRLGKERFFRAVMEALTAMALLGCAGGILPSNVAKSKAPWATYGEAKAAFDRILLNRTTFEELKGYGFDAGSWPNVKVINYVEVAGLFGSAFERKDLPEGIRKCVTAEDGCTAYVMRAQNIHARRNGNIAADLFGFRKQTHTTGWEMTATVVLVNKVVVYKLWSGTPEIDTYEKQVTPLGPMQNMGGMFKPF